MIRCREEFATEPESIVIASLKRGTTTSVV
jgi:hypothetical protein